MDYKEKYNKLVEAIKVLQKVNPSDEGIQNWVNDNVPELAESEDDKIIKEIISIVKSYRESCITEGNHRFDKCISWLEKQKPTLSKGDKEYLTNAIHACSCRFGESSETTEWLKSIKERICND